MPNFIIEYASVINFSKTKGRGHRFYLKFKKQGITTSLHTMRMERNKTYQEERINQ